MNFCSLTGPPDVKCRKCGLPAKHGDVRTCTAARKNAYMPFIIVNRPLCSFLGEMIGTVKMSCSGDWAEYHKCLHPKRKWITRRQEIRDGVCIPKGYCSDLSQAYQSCQMCSLHKPQLLLEEK